MFITEQVAFSVYGNGRCLL